MKKLLICTLVNEYLLNHQKMTDTFVFQLNLLAGISLKTETVNFFYFFKRKKTEDDSYCLNLVLNAMTVAESNTLHAICEVEKNHLSTTILAMSERKDFTFQNK